MHKAISIGCCWMRKACCFSLSKQQYWHQSSEFSWILEFDWRIAEVWLPLERVLKRRI
nr:hypothetical protein [Nostoc sp. ZfuVER08]